MINLLPPDIKREVRFARFNVTLIQYVILVIAISVGVIAIMIFGGNLVASNESSLNDIIDDEKARVAELAPVNEEAKELSQKIDLIGAILIREVKLSELLTNIGGLMPTGSVLTTLSLSETKDDPIILEASIQDESTAAVLRENLVNSELFSNADIISITLVDEPTRAPNGQVYRFNASLHAYFTPEEPPKAVTPEGSVELEAEPESPPPTGGGR